jgi:hypothetical protein
VLHSFVPSTHNTCGPVLASTLCLLLVGVAGLVLTKSNAAAGRCLMQGRGLLVVFMPVGSCSFQETLLFKDLGSYDLRLQVCTEVDRDSLGVGVDLCQLQAVGQ